MEFSNLVAELDIEVTVGMNRIIRELEKEGIDEDSIIELKVIRNIYNKFMVRLEKEGR